MKCELRVLFVGLLIAMFPGCSGKMDKWAASQPETVAAEGIVTLDGKAVDGAVVVFAPVQESGGFAATAPSDSSGRFRMQAFPNKPGAVPGSYMVQVSKTEEVSGAAKGKFNPGLDSEHAEAAEAEGFSWKNVLPQKYANPTTSGITIEVPASGVTDLKIELSSK